MSERSPHDQSHLFHNAKPSAPSRAEKPRELLFEFHVERTHKIYRCELLDHGPDLGVEAQFFDPVELTTSRRFDPRLDASRQSRELAVQWAEETRALLERGGDVR